MASSKPLFATLFITFLFYVVVASSDSDGESSYKKSKRTYIHLFLHEQIRGDNATETAVAFGGNNTVNPDIPFGLTAVYDYLATEKNDTSSKQVAKAQGLLALSSQSENSVTMGTVFVFTNEKYNGSSLVVLGQNNLYWSERELPIIGGTGLFRFARGYIKTYTVYSSSDYKLFDWKFYVSHY